MSNLVVHYRGGPKDGAVETMSDLPSGTLTPRILIPNPFDHGFDFWLYKLSWNDEEEFYEYSFNGWRKNALV